MMDTIGSIERTADSFAKDYGLECGCIWGAAVWLEDVIPGIVKSIGPCGSNDGLIRNLWYTLGFDCCLDFTTSQ